MPSGRFGRVQKSGRAAQLHGADPEARSSLLSRAFILGQARDAPAVGGQDSLRELVLEIKVLVAQLSEVADALPSGPERACVLENIALLKGTIAQYGEPVPPSFA